MHRTPSPTGEAAIANSDAADAASPPGAGHDVRETAEAPSPSVEDMAEASSPSAEGVAEAPSPSAEGVDAAAAASAAPASPDDDGSGREETVGAKAAPSSSESDAGEASRPAPPRSVPGAVTSSRRAWNEPARPAETARSRAAGPVSFSIPEGSYNPPITLFLSCATGDAQIRYTEDGSEPTARSPLFVRGDSLFYTASTVVSARAYAEGMEPGPVTTQRYALQAAQWKVLEPADRTDAVPHQCGEQALDFAPGWSLAAASTRGRLHAHRGAWREDAYAYGRRGPWIILAVSDGAGSAPLSRIGSRTACERAVEELRERLPTRRPTAGDEATLKAEELPALQVLLANAGRAALNGLREEAARRGKPVEAFAATLLLAVLCPWKGKHLVAGLQVGDGQIALLTRADGGHECKLLGEADHGEHSSETRFLTTRGVEETLEHRVRFTFPQGLEAVALLSDGISDDFFPEDRRLVELFTGRSLAGMTGRDGAPVDGLLHGVTRAPEPARALGEWIEYDRKGSSDDRTLLLLWAGR